MMDDLISAQAEAVREGKTLSHWVMTEGCYLRFAAEKGSTDMLTAKGPQPILGLRTELVKGEESEFTLCCVEDA